MMLSKSKHLGHYISLILILGFGIAAFSFASSHKSFQMAIIVLTALFYVFWGIFHHSSNHSLNTKIVIEYVLIGSLGIAALFFFLMGGFI